MKNNLLLKLIVLFLIMVFFTLNIFSANISRAGENESEIILIKNTLVGENQVWFDSLIKYMPQTDIVNIDINYIQNDFNAIIKSRASTPWAKKISDDIFFHYILPYRVSQEPMNDFRALYSDSLLKYIENVKTMKDAAYKINEWVFVHASYIPTSPWDQNSIITLRRGKGRCEELAILLIMALRSVYIPARYVYSPWWPFTNSNHAWVEVYIDNKWESIGSGELNAFNYAWFNMPVKRTAIVAGNVWGHSAESDVLISDSMYSINNYTKNYADTKKLKINVYNANNEPVKDVKINIYVYNYSAFRTIAKGETDINGIYTINIGKTDLIVSAGKDSLKQIKFIRNDEINIDMILGDETVKDTSFWFNVIKPINKKRKKATYKVDETVYLNQRINTAKINFMDNIAHLSMIDINDSIIIEQLLRAKGNYKNIINSYNNANRKKDITRFLKSLYDKDIINVDERQIEEFIEWYKSIKINIEHYNDTIVENYILNPRIYYESFSFYQNELYSKYFEKFYLKDISETVNNVMEYIDSEIDTINKCYKSVFGGMLNPLDVIRGGRGRPVEKLILIVGILRSIGIPAKIDYTLKGIEYYDNIWHNTSIKKDRGKICKLKIIFYNDDYTENMQNEYYYDYTINKWENDRINSLEPDIKMLGDTTLIEVQYSHYFIINGWRNSFGKSYIRIKPFEINDSIYVLKVNSGIPFEYVENNLCMKDFNINDFKGIMDINNNRLSKHKLSRGRNLLILFDVNSESSISTINNLFKNELLIEEKINNVYILAISDKSKTHDYFKDFKMDYDIYFVDEQIIKNAFKTDIFPSILLLNNGELIMWLEGLQTGIYKIVENILK